MKKVVVILAVLIAFAAAGTWYVASSPQEAAPGEGQQKPEAVAQNCAGEATDFTANMSQEELAKWAEDNGGSITLTPTGGSCTTYCPTGARSCSPCGSSCFDPVDLGVTSCKLQSGQCLECTFGATVHAQSCSCGGGPGPCPFNTVDLWCE